MLRPSRGHRRSDTVAFGFRCILFADLVRIIDSFVLILSFELELSA
jgi:hypothetical protein